MRNIIAALFVSCLNMVGYSQAPDGFKYQAVVRNSTGTVLSNQTSAFKFSIRQGSVNGPVKYSERHEVVSNDYGLVNLVIGEGEPLTGSFTSILWDVANHFIKIEVDINGGTSYEELGTLPLLSVPYALHARTAENTFSGNYYDLTNAPQDISEFNNDVGYITSFTEVDGSISNELQTISLNGNSLTLSNGGGTVTLPSGGGSDNWGNQVVISDNTLTGNGTAGSPLSVNSDLIDNQNLSSTSNGINRTINISGGTGTTFSVADNDNSPSNEIQTLSLNGSDLTLSNGGGTVTLLSGSLDAPVIVIDASNYNTIDNVPENSIVIFQGAINISEATYQKVDEDGTLINGGEIIGTGSNEMNFSFNSSIHNVHFRDITIDATSETTFFNCTFTNCALDGGRYTNCRIVSCTNSGIAIEQLDNCEVDDSDLYRIRTMTGTEVDNSLLGMGGGYMHYISNCDIENTEMTLTRTMTGSELSDSKVNLQPNDEVTITGNLFDDGYTSSGPIISIDVEDSGVSLYTIVGNTFNATNDANSHILVSGSYTGSYGVTTISNNIFYNGDKAIDEFSGGFDIIFTNNVLIGINEIGISSSSLHVVRDNEEL